MHPNMKVSAWLQKAPVIEFRQHTQRSRERGCPTSEWSDGLRLGMCVRCIRCHPGKWGPELPQQARAHRGGSHDDQASMQPGEFGLEAGRQEAPSSTKGRDLQRARRTVAAEVAIRPASRRAASSSSGRGPAARACWAAASAPLASGPASVPDRGASAATYDCSSRRRAGSLAPPAAQGVHRRATLIECSHWMQRVYLRDAV